MHSGSTEQVQRALGGIEARDLRVQARLDQALATRLLGVATVHQTLAWLQGYLLGRYISMALRRLMRCLAIEMNPW